MRIGGLQKVSLIDYPGRISAVVFTQGCNFRCPYCHNPDLVPPDPPGALLPGEEVLAFLEKRRGRLDGVVLTGGEPTVQTGLTDFLEAVRAMGYPVKLDTNGSNPAVLERLLGRGLLDYVAMDLKAPEEKYGLFTGPAVPFSRIGETMNLLRFSGVPFEFRTTVAPSLLSEGDLRAILDLLAPADRFVLQRFVPSRTLDPRLAAEKGPSAEEIARLAKTLSRNGRTILAR
jgi:pyruvate formate lyase activating enzyme